MSAWSERRLQEQHVSGVQHAGTVQQKCSSGERSTPPPDGGGDGVGVGVAVGVAVVAVVAPPADDRDSVGSRTSWL